MVQYYPPRHLSPSSSIQLTLSPKFTTTGMIDCWPPFLVVGAAWSQSYSWVFCRHFQPVVCSFAVIAHVLDFSGIASRMPTDKDDGNEHHCEQSPFMLLENQKAQWLTSALRNPIWTVNRKRRLTFRRSAANPRAESAHAVSLSMGPYELCSCWFIVCLLLGHPCTCL